MTGRKCLASATSDSGNSATKKAKRQLAVSPFEKWQHNYNKNHQSLTWLKCDVDTQNKNCVAVLWCSVRRVQSRICSMKNYSQACITGSGNHRVSNMLDHARSDQHVMAMSHLRNCPSECTARARCELRANCTFAVDAGGVRVRMNATQV